MVGNNRYLHIFGGAVDFSFMRAVQAIFQTVLRRRFIIYRNNRFLAAIDFAYDKRKYCHARQSVFRSEKTREKRRERQREDFQHDKIQNDEQ